MAKVGRWTAERIVPGFDEVVAAGVGDDAEGCVGCVGGEDVADELVAFDQSAWGFRRRGCVS